MRIVYIYQQIGLDSQENTCQSTSGPFTLHIPKKLFRPGLFLTLSSRFHRLAGFWLWCEIGFRVESHGGISLKESK
jgi:hypothetical protein